MKLKQMTLSLMALLFLANCGMEKQRFGETVKSSKGDNTTEELPILIKPALEEAEAIELYEKTLLSDLFKDSKEIQRKWKQTQQILKTDNPENRLKKASLGTLYKLLEADKTGNRLPPLQIWFIEYGAKASAQDYPFLEKIVIEKYLSRSDLDAVLIGVYLINFSSVTEEQFQKLKPEEKLSKARLDKYFLGK